MALLETIVRITTLLRPRGVLRRETGRTLFVTTDASYLGASGTTKVKTYSRLGDVGEDFASDAAPYLGARTYFSQRPFPRNLLIGRWVNADVDHVLTSGPVSALAMLTAIDDGSFSFGGFDFDGLDLSGAGSFADVATSLQAEIRTEATLAGATVAYNARDSRFVVTVPLAVAGVGYFGPHSAAAGTDVSTLLALTQAAGANFVIGQAAETVSEAMDAIQRIDSGFTLLGHEAGMNGQASSMELAAWVGANPGVTGCIESNEAAAILANDATAVISQIAAANYNGVARFWDEVADYKGLSLMARFSSIDFDAANSLITGMFKTAPGTTPSTLSEDAINELSRKRINFYTNFGDEPIFAEGWIGGDATYIDVQVWINWLENASQVAVFNLLRQAPRVPRNGPFGLARIKETLEGVCRIGLRNGGLAPGLVSPEMAADIRSATGQEFDGLLTNGYLVHHAQVTVATPVRTAPSFETFLRGSSAVHGVNIAQTFEE